jgi:hypothetical protein
MSGKIRAALCVVLAAAGVTGCAGLNGYSVRDEAALQQDVIGDVVHVGATLCLDDDVDDVAQPALRSAARSLGVAPNGDGTCDATPDQAGFYQGFADNGGIQFFAAFRVPDGTVAPATAAARLPSGFEASHVTLTRKRSLDETLEQTRPAPAGEHWVGYISPVLGAAAVEQDQPSDVAGGLARVAAADRPPAVEGSTDWTVGADFTISRGAGGLPAPAGFAHAVLGGVRMAYPQAIYEGIDPAGLNAAMGESFGLQLLDTRPVDCQEYRGFPFPEVYGTSLDGLDANQLGMALIPTTLCGRASAGGTLALKDLRGSGGSVTVAPGATAQMPFTLRYVGGAGPSFALSASSAVPGAPVSATPAVLTPAAGFHDVTVAVAVPAGTAPGAYSVTLTATVGDQVRTTQGTLSVTAPGAPAPTGADQAAASVAATGTGAANRGRMLEFRGFDRSGVGPDGKTINLGDVLCHKAQGSCGWVTVQLSVRWEQLHAGAEAARAASRRRVRMVVIGTGRLSVPAGARRRVQVTLPPSVRRLLAEGEILHAVAAVRPARNRVPLTHRIALRRG